MEIRFVRQANRRSGCGPACIAMLAGNQLPRSPTAAYSEAIKLIFRTHRKRDLRTGWRELRAVLDRFDIPYADRIHRHRSWDAIKTLSIVKCGESGKDGENWHWVVYDGQMGILYNPLKDGPHRPTGRTRKPRSHLPILA